MSPLETLAELCARYGHAEWARELDSLAAREEMRSEGFWEDVAAERLWTDAPSGLAGLELGGGRASETDAARFRRALALLAEDLALRGVSSPASDAFLARARA